ncbi:MAG: BamA/TamA family outer membrane protein [bacterium]
MYIRPRQEMSEIPASILNPFMLNKFARIRPLLLIILLSAGLGGSPATVAQTTDSTAPVIRSIRFEGKFRLREYILRREIDSEVGRPLDTLLLLRDRRKLDGFRLFSQVQTRVEKQNDSVDVIFLLKEVWTLWPLLSVSNSDNSFDWLVGVREKDFLGLYLRTSIFYRRYEGENSYGCSAQFPRAFGRDLALGWNLGESREVDPLTFVDPATGRREISDYRYLSKYLWVNGGIRINEVLYLSGYTGYERENWTLKDDQELPAGASEVYDYPRYIISAAATMGRVYFDDFLLEGRDLTISATLVNEQPAGSLDRWRLGISGRQYFIWGAFNLALRAQYATSSADERMPPYYISGIVNVRGYEDKIERGDHFTGGNLELRWRGFESSLFLTQLAAFVDAGAVWGRDADFSTALDDGYLSVGAGLRLAVKKFLGRIGRFDVARDTRTGRWEYYLAAHQFF